MNDRARSGAAFAAAIHDEDAAKFAALRENMIERQLVRRGIDDPGVLMAMRSVPREEFVRANLREFAYEDAPLPIEAGQTISQPYIVALMAQAARIRAGDRVLEIGAGSGYAAAVIAAIGAQVFAIERHAELAELARDRFARLGYANIELRVGDGSVGWPEAAPFDVILAAAGGPSVPALLLRQLVTGGRLVMPVGDTQGSQRLLKLTATGQDNYESEDLGPVAFVPLIGKHGWSTSDARTPSPALDDGNDTDDHDEASILASIREAAVPLPEFDDPAFGRAFDDFAAARVILLGEASHGTSEFYLARAAITRRLIEAHGFNIVAVEADWPDAAAIDRHVRLKPARDDEAPAFQRFPTWMWRNAEVAGFVEWLRRHNSGRDPALRAGFYGLDLYSLNRSIRAVIDYLEGVDPEAARIARHRYGCLTPWAKAPAEYGHLALNAGYGMCERQVTDTLRALLERRLEYAAHDGESFLDAAQNARLVRNAEAYYRAMYYGTAESWNLRDTHMFETLQQLLAARGTDAKAVVWAHNSHIGDARHTEMGWTRGELNIGQLCREHFGEQAVSIGFGTHAGTVAAADDWDAPMQVMQVQPSLTGSYERLFHDAGHARCLCDLRAGRTGRLHERLARSRLERFIGVIYRPDSERLSHYAEAVLPRQFDALVWFDVTRAVDALPAPGRSGGVPDTWPFGL
ncbi:protein-L-isoaspartate(D-aspartate) O-methyltransferase [Luteimonas cucumeris]|uniref:Protein-L-isoaspartate O-methyltransferase n=1 Tax=Luteimonas cucumeris TaxID=985012 RepID=A0A562LDJ7_9GAMM|nr:protein-L-isoaspartate(D-aspartate) O-methyltransferase [Luteimonas cucumeris]TWI05759.1 protein-L-isoaspartate(D-aspartate) O-methyltransferase [Luteimonas cucumeris]